jgi:hypothetical protein
MSDLMMEPTTQEAKIAFMRSFPAFSLSGGATNSSLTNWRRIRPVPSSFCLGTLPIFTGPSLANTSQRSLRLDPCESFRTCSTGCGNI